MNYTMVSDIKTGSTEYYKPISGRYFVEYANVYMPVGDTLYKIHTGSYDGYGYTHYEAYKVGDSVPCGGRLTVQIMRTYKAMCDKTVKEFRLLLHTAPRITPSDSVKAYFSI